MAFALDLNDATLEISLRRIASEELGFALARLPRTDRPEAVHAIRKHIKKTRAVLRLVRTGLAVQPEENSNLRSIALALATRRDASARLITFQSLFPDPPACLSPLRDHLVTATQAADDPISEDVREALSALRARAAHWTLRGKDDTILRQGLADTRRKAIRALKAARADPTSELLIHDLRKRAKDHWYQARLFAPCWPELFKPLAATADRLGESLGEHHDLTLFAHQIAGLSPEAVPDEARCLLDAAIDSARTRIADAAFPTAARLFAGDPDDVAALWVDWRKVWRRKV